MDMNQIQVKYEHRNRRFHLGSGLVKKLCGETKFILKKERFFLIVPEMDSEKESTGESTIPE
jgi:hypothetical protein